MRQSIHQTGDNFTGANSAKTKFDTSVDKWRLDAHCNQSDAHTVARASGPRHDDTTMKPLLNENWVYRKLVFNGKVIQFA